MTSMRHGNSWFEAQAAELGFWIRFCASIPQSRAKLVASRLEEGNIRIKKHFGLPISSVRGRVLDVGCSPISVHEGRDGTEVVAIDPLFDGYCQELPVFARAGRVANVEYRCCEIQDIEDDPFDVVWCINVLDHTDDWRDIVRHFGRLAKGLLLIGVDVRHGELDSPCHISIIIEDDLLEEITADFTIEWHTPINLEADKYFFNVRARVA